MKYKKIVLIADDTDKATQAKTRLKHLYDFLKTDVEPEKADLVLVLGGDGLMLHMLHRLMGKNIPVFGMNRGTIGFLMNNYDEKNLVERINTAEEAQLHPLEMNVKCSDGTKHKRLAINEVSLLRETAQAAKIKVQVDGKTQLEEMICDGVIVSTPAGSTAYNFSANGPVVPLGTGLLALTPISVFRPRRWRGALLPSNKTITLKIQETAKRPVSAVADFHEIRDVAEVQIIEQKKYCLRILFDSNNSLQERIIKEQFIL